MTSVLDARPVVPAEITGSRAPLIRCVPEYVSTSGPEVAELAARAGLVLDPWEADVLDDFQGETEDGDWAATECGLIVPRQNGKGSIVEARELGGLYLFREPLLVHTAHEVKTSGEAFLRILTLINDCDDFSREVKRVNKSHGEEGIELLATPTIILGHGGKEIRRSVAPRLRFVARSRVSGLGFTGRFIVLDEAFELLAAMMAALVPTLSAQAMFNPQLWYTSTPPDQEKDPNARVLSGLRAQALKGAPRMAWREWGADVSHLDGMSEAQADAERKRMRRDPLVIAQANPGLGIRLTLQFTETELRNLTPKGYDVMRLGIGDWPPPDDDEAAWDVIPQDDWTALLDPASQMPGVVAFAADASADQKYAAISVAGMRADGRLHVELIDHRKGTAWIPARLAELNEKWMPCAVVIDPKREAGQHISEAAELGVEVTTTTALQMVQACAAFYTACCDTRTLAHRGDPDLAYALGRASKRDLEGAWAWDGRSETDISPLVSATLALWGCQQFGGMDAGVWVL